MLTVRRAEYAGFSSWSFCYREDLLITDKHGNLVVAVLADCRVEQEKLKEIASACVMSQLAEHPGAATLESSQEGDTEPKVFPSFRLGPYNRYGMKVSIISFHVG